MMKYTEQDVKFITEMERGAVEIKAVALALTMLFVGVVAGFLVAYGIANWGW